MSVMLESAFKHVAHELPQARALALPRVAVGDQRPATRADLLRQRGVVQQPQRRCREVARRVCDEDMLAVHDSQPFSPFAGGHDRHAIGQCFENLDACARSVTEWRDEDARAAQHCVDGVEPTGELKMIVTDADRQAGRRRAGDNQFN